MTLDPPRRTFSEGKGKGVPKNVDARGRAQKLQILGWSLYGGLPLGLIVGSLLGQTILGGIVGPLLIYAAVYAFAKGVGRGAAFLHLPSGSSTPRRREYSRASALQVRGAFDEAIRAYEGAILEEPETGEPYLRIARIFRDDLEDPDSAVRWFRRAQVEAELTAGESIRTHRELAEIFLHRTGEPQRAAPHLALLAEGYPHTSHGVWAAGELARIKEEMISDAPDANGGP